MTEAAVHPDTASVARAYFEAVGRRDRNAQLDWYAADATARMPGLLDEPTPREHARAFFHELYDAFPDFRLEILDLIADGDTAAVRWRATGTFNGPGAFQGLEPNGRAIDLDGMDMVWVSDGKIARLEASVDGATMSRQLGALPPRGSQAEKAMVGALNLVTRARRALAR